MFVVKSTSAFSYYVALGLLNNRNLKVYTVKEVCCPREFSAPAKKWLNSDKNKSKSKSVVVKENCRKDVGETGNLLASIFKFLKFFAPSECSCTEKPSKVKTHNATYYFEPTIEKDCPNCPFKDWKPRIPKLLPDEPESYTTEIQKKVCFAGMVKGKKGKGKEYWEIIKPDIKPKLSKKSKGKHTCDINPFTIKESQKITTPIKICLPEADWNHDG